MNGQVSLTYNIYCEIHLHLCANITLDGGYEKTLGNARTRTSERTCTRIYNVILNIMYTGQIGLNYNRDDLLEWRERVCSGILTAITPPPSYPSLSPALLSLLLRPHSVCRPPTLSTNMFPYTPVISNKDINTLNKYYTRSHTHTLAQFLINFHN